MFIFKHLAFDIHQVEKKREEIEKRGQMTVANKLAFHMSPHHLHQNVSTNKVLKSQLDIPGMSTEPLTKTLHGTVSQKPASHVLVSPVANPTVSPSNTLSLNATNLY